MEIDMHNSPQTKQKIIDIALQLFNEYGFEKVTIKQICTKLGLGRSAFYYHFRSKEQILVEYYRPDKAYTTERMAWIISAPTNIERAFRVQLAIEHHISEINDPESLMYYMAYSIKKDIQDEIIDAIQVKTLLLPLIKNGQKNGEIRNEANPEVICDTALNIQRGLLMHYCMKKGKLNREKLLRDQLKALYNTDEDFISTIS